MVKLRVSLLSGENFEATASSVEELRQLVRKERGILVKQFLAQGKALRGSLEDHEGGELMAVSCSSRLVSSRNCKHFALIRRDGTVTPVGSSHAWCLDSPVLQKKLRDVKDMVASKGAYAAILVDGSVMVWGDPASGGYVGDVEKELHDIEEVVPTIHGFAARRADGRVVCWGLAQYGGDASQVQDQLREVKSLYATKYAFAALKVDGTVVTWGESQCGGDSSHVQDDLKDVRDIASTARAFAAHLEDGRVVAWGHPEAGGDSEAVRGLQEVARVCGTRNAFAALKENGELVVWGQSPGPAPARVHGDELLSNDGAWCIKGEYVNAWGDERYGGRAPPGLCGIRELAASSYAFAALKDDGTVVSWGHGQPRLELERVRQLLGSADGFAALDEDDTVTTW